MNEPNEESKQPASEVEQLKQASASKPVEEVRKLVIPDMTTAATQADDDRSPGLDRQASVVKLPTTPPVTGEVIRELIVPEAANVSQSDDDRSPGLDRDANIVKPIAPVAETAVRKPIVPEPANPKTDLEGY